MTSTHARRFIHSSTVIDSLKNEPIGSILPETESQCRPLTQLNTDDQLTVWKQIVDKHPEKRTAKVIENLKNENNAGLN